MNKCKNCGKDLIDNAKSCPECGRDQKSIFGRNKILTVIGVSLLLCMIIIAGQGWQEAAEPEVCGTPKPESTNAGDESIETFVVIEMSPGMLLEKARENDERFNQYYAEQLLLIYGDIHSIEYISEREDYYIVTISDDDGSKLAFVRIMVPLEYEDFVMDLEKGDYVNIYMNYIGYETGSFVDGEYVPAEMVRN